MVEVKEQGQLVERAVTRDRRRVARLGKPPLLTRDQLTTFQATVSVNCDTDYYSPPSKLHHLTLYPSTTSIAATLVRIDLKCVVCV